MASEKDITELQAELIELRLSGENRPIDFALSVRYALLLLLACGGRYADAEAVLFETNRNEN